MKDFLEKLDTIPDTEDIEIKPGFEDRYRKLLGSDYGDFLRYSLSFLNKSIRVNTLKVDVETVKERLSEGWSLESIPWCKEGFWIEDKEKERYDIGNIPEHQLGYFYVQEAASMIPPLVLNPGVDDKVLDMCAAPGSKTTQMASLMNNKGVLVANDVSTSRMGALGINIQKCGVENAVMTQMPGHVFKHKETRFDKVLVDAPCSGTGTIRTSLRTLKTWNPDSIRKLQGVQKQLLDSGFGSLEKGGVVVYSTCTLEPEENEEVVTYLLDKYEGAELVSFDLDINESEVVREFNGESYHRDIDKCLRIYPQDNNTEGFFVAKIKKK